jgi:hypothetical protein
MQLETTLAVELVALEIADGVDVLIDVAAPAGAHAARLVIRPSDSVPAFTIWDDLPVRGAGDGIVVELGDLHAAERRRIVLGFQEAGSDAATICKLELRWLDRGSMTENAATVQVRVG